MGSDIVKSRVAEFYNELEPLSDEHIELTDTDVREAIHLALNYYFVWGKARARLPISYYMFSLEADRAVARAVERFLVAADDCFEISRIPLGQARLDLLQDESIRTPCSETYDLFIGHSDEPLQPDQLPQRMFEEPDYEHFGP